MDITVTVPGAGFARGTEALRQDLIDKRNDDLSNLPVARIFEFIQLTQSNQSAQRKLLRRGSFERVGPNVFRNSARRNFNERLRDIGPNLDSILLSISKTLTLNIEVTEVGELITFLVDETDSKVLISFDEPPAPGFGRSFILKTVEGRLNSWSYRMVGEFDEDQVVVIVVDLTLSASVRFAASTSFKSLNVPGLILRPSTIQRVHGREEIAANGLFSACECECCQAKPNRRPHRCPEDEVALGLRLRCVVVSDNNAASLRNQFQQDLRASQILFSREVDMVLSDGGTTSFEDPVSSTFQALDASKRLTPEAQRVLNKYLPATVPNTITCIYVTSLVGNTLGVARIDNILNPWLFVEIGANNVTLSHEIGHVLGLQHVTDNLTRNLMNGSATDDELKTDQVKTMRCSQLNKVLPAQALTG